MTTKITNISELTNNSLSNSPEITLSDALSDIGKNGALKNGKKCLILALDESDGNYSVNYYNAGMKASECIALLDISKALFVEDMGY